MLDELWVEEGEPGKLILRDKEYDSYHHQAVPYMNNMNMNNNKQMMLSTSTWSRFIMKSLSVGVNSVPSLVNCRSKFDTSFR